MLDVRWKFADLLHVLVSVFNAGHYDAHSRKDAVVAQPLIIMRSAYPPFLAGWPPERFLAEDAVGHHRIGSAGGLASRLPHHLASGSALGGSG
jgi:hypothetical protein